MSNDQVIQMTVGNRLPGFSAAVLAANGSPMDLTGYDMFVVVTAPNGGDVFGEPSPLIRAVDSVDANSVVVVDWTQPEVDALEPGSYTVSVRGVSALDPEDSFEVAPISGKRIVVRSESQGYTYLVTQGGALVFTQGGNPISLDTSDVGVLATDELAVILTGDGYPIGV